MSERRAARSERTRFAFALCAALAACCWSARPCIAQPALPAIAASGVAVDAPRPVAFAELSVADAQSSAVASSPEVAAARAIVAESAAALSSARRAIGPSFDASYVEAPQGGASGQTISQRITTIGLGTSFGDLAGYSSLVAAAAASLRSAQASLIAAQRSERVKAIGLYYDALRARAVALARSQTLETARGQQRAAEIRVRAGDAPRLDVIRANVAVARAIAADALAGAADHNATDALRTETIPSARLAVTVDGVLARSAPLAPEVAAARARANRADLRAASEATAAARAAASASRIAALPTITVMGGFASGVDSGIAVHGPALNVTMNLPLTGAAQAQTRGRTAVVEETLARAQALDRQVTLDIAASARNVAASQAATVATAQARDQAYDELAATELGYRSGATSSLDVAAARDTYTQALVDALSSAYDELKARAILDLETGP